MQRYQLESLNQCFQVMEVKFYTNHLIRTYGIGAEIWNVRQRSLGSYLATSDYSTLTGHINFYYKEPMTRVLFQLKGGRFLAEDSGFSFNFSREFKSGLNMGVFFSLTDISKAEFGEGSFDKGFFFNIPIQVFFDQFSRGASGFGLRPLTRDGAQPLTVAQSYGAQQIKLIVIINLWLGWIL